MDFIMPVAMDGCISDPASAYVHVCDLHTANTWIDVCACMWSTYIIHMHTALAPVLLSHPAFPVNLGLDLSPPSDGLAGSRKARFWSSWQGRGQHLLLIMAHKSHWNKCNLHIFHFLATFCPVVTQNPAPASDAVESGRFRMPSPPPNAAELEPNHNRPIE
jgi:hypothetical protein